MALTALAAWFGIDAFRAGDARGIRRAGLALAAAAMTRYEAWPFAAALLLLGVLSSLGQGRSFRESIVARLPARGLPGCGPAGVCGAEPGDGRRMVRSVRVLHRREPGFPSAASRPPVRLVGRARTDQLPARCPGRCRPRRAAGPFAAGAKPGLLASRPRPGWRGDTSVVRVLLGPPVPHSLHGSACPGDRAGRRVRCRAGWQTEADGGRGRPRRGGDEPRTARSCRPNGRSRRSGIGRTRRAGPGLPRTCGCTGTARP